MAPLVWDLMGERQDKPTLMSAFAKTAFTVPIATKTAPRVVSNRTVAFSAIAWRPRHGHQEVTLVPPGPMIEPSSVRTDCIGPDARSTARRIVRKPTAVRVAIVWRLPHGHRGVILAPLAVTTRPSIAGMDSLVATLVTIPVRRIVLTIIAVHKVIAWQPTHELQGVTTALLNLMIEPSSARTHSLVAIRVLIAAQRIVHKRIAVRMAIAWQLPHARRGAITKLPAPMIRPSFAKTGFMATLVTSDALGIVPTAFAALMASAWRLPHAGITVTME